eukprot:5826296-Amphidinium_carterae.1
MERTPKGKQKARDKSERQRVDPATSSTGSQGSANAWCITTPKLHIGSAEAIGFTAAAAASEGRCSRKDRSSAAHG